MACYHYYGIYFCKYDQLLDFFVVNSARRMFSLESVTLSSLHYQSCTLSQPLPRHISPLLPTNIRTNVRDFNLPVLFCQRKYNFCQRNSCSVCLDEICNPIDPFHSSSSRNSKSKIQFYIQKILTSHILAICNNLSTYIIWLRVFVASHAQTSYIFNDETHRIHFHKLQRTNQLPTLQLYFQLSPINFTLSFSGCFDTFYQFFSPFF